MLLPDVHLDSSSIAKGTLELSSLLGTLDLTPSLPEAKEELEAAEKQLAAEGKVAAEKVRSDELSGVEVASRAAFIKELTKLAGGCSAPSSSRFPVAQSNALVRLMAVTEVLLGELSAAVAATEEEAGLRQVAATAGKLIPMLLKALGMDEGKTEPAEESRVPAPIEDEGNDDAEGQLMIWCMNVITIIQGVKDPSFIVKTLTLNEGWIFCR